MPPKQRQIQSQMKAQQSGMLQAMERLEQRSDEELEREQRQRAAAQAILGSRAAERYDAKATRAHFRRALAAARPQERIAIRRMADASLALAERRAGDLKVAVERLGQEAPSSRQLLMLRLLGLIAPPAGSGILKRVRGIATVVLIVASLLAAGWAVVSLIALPFGGISTISAVWLGLVFVILVIVAMAIFGRRRQRRLRAERSG